MKKLFKTPKIAKEKGFHKVKKSIKKFLKELTPEQQEKPLLFFYHSEYDYPTGKKPIMYVCTEEVSNDWTKWFKLEKSSNKFATVICSFDKKNKLLKIEIQQGKGGKNETIKEVHKELLKPFATIEVVDKLESNISASASASTDDSNLETTPTLSDYDNAQLPTYIKEAKVHVSNILASQKELNLIVETLEPKVKKLNAIVITDALIQYSQEALATFKEIDISAIKQEVRAFKSLLPKKLLKENTDLNKEIENLNKLTAALDQLKPRISKLSQKCLRIQKVKSPSESAAAPISTNPIENFGIRLNKIIKSSTLNKI
jgi:hypothetical protein